MHWRRCADALFRSAPGGVLVLSLRGGDAVWLAAPGDVVWTLLDEPRSLDELATELASRYATPPDVVEADCRTLLGDLSARGLIEITSP